MSAVHMRRRVLLFFSTINEDHDFTFERKSFLFIHSFIHSTIPIAHFMGNYWGITPDSSMI